MKLDTLIEAVLPTLIDELEGYTKLELSLIALGNNSEELASSIVNIAKRGDEFFVISSEVQVYEQSR